MLDEDEDERYFEGTESVFIDFFLQSSHLGSSSSC